MSTGGGAGDQWERLRDRAEMRGRERRRGWKRREGHRGLSGSQPWNEAGVAVGGEGTLTHLVTSGPPILSGSSATLGEGDRDRVSNLDIGSPLPKTHCIQDSGQPMPWPRFLPTGWHSGEGKTWSQDVILSLPRRGAHSEMVSAEDRKILKT